ncbi:MAG TPA: dTDP-4-dehydrorhamnose 3,5-epimerase family protein [Chloroflexota bacterium]|nr:dTDP-4-dehydrorhamnose 3,5-epimerase family protein [Chloroflexota bacterium]
MQQPWGQTAFFRGYTETPDGDLLPPLRLVAEDTGKFTAFRIWATPLDGLLVWERTKYDDARGSYQELSKVEEIGKALGRPVEVKQVSLSRNRPRGVLRGFHAEPIDKIVTPLNGRLFIAIADLRPHSPTFGQSVAFVLDHRDDEKPKRSIVVSSGLGNSFLTIGDPGDPLVHYLYEISEAYKSSEGKRSVRWDDPDLAIPWPIQPEIMSAVDATGNPSLREITRR